MGFWKRSKQNRWVGLGVGLRRSNSVKVTEYVKNKQHDKYSSRGPLNIQHDKCKHYHRQRKLNSRWPNGKEFLISILEEIFNKGISALVLHLTLVMMVFRTIARRLMNS